MSVLPSGAAERNEYPMADGMLYYFPSALAAVARVSKIGNAQHNGDSPMHWARNKSTDHANKIIRHLMDAGTMDSDGTRHSAKVAWRALALLEDELIAAGATPGRNAVGSPGNAARRLDKASAEAIKRDAKSALAGLAAESKKLGLYDDGIPAESACLASFAPNDDIPEKSPINSRLDIDWNACFPTRAQLDAAITGKPPLEPSRIATPAELAYLASFGPNECTSPREDVPPMFVTLRDIPTTFTDLYGNGITRRVASQRVALSDDHPLKHVTLYGREDSL